MISKDMILENR